MPLVLLLMEASYLHVILIALLILSFLTQVGFILLVFWKVGDKTELDEVSEPLPALSVIIAARNEQDALADRLPLILEQDYPNFEVVVVNDSSWDETAEILKAFAERYRHLKVVNIPENQHPFAGKKLALTLGIKAAVNPHLVFTDADCKPASQMWLRQVGSAFSRNVEVILGYGAYEPGAGLAALIQRTEAFLVGINFLGFAKNGAAYMGVGRNLAYSKSVYTRVNGFRKHYFLASGDDDLLVHAAAPVAITWAMPDYQAKTLSIPAQDFLEYWRQKRRHLTTASFYRASTKVLLALYPVSLLALYCAAILMVVFNFPAQWLIAAGGMVMVRLILCFKWEVFWILQVTG